MKEIRTLDEWISSGDAVYGDEPMCDRLVRAKSQLINGINMCDLRIEQLEASKKQHQAAIEKDNVRLEETLKDKESYSKMLEEATERLKQLGDNHE